jgi:hypothetical protein
MIIGNLFDITSALKIVKTSRLLQKLGTVHNNYRIRINNLSFLNT